MTNDRYNSIHSKRYQLMLGHAPEVSLNDVLLPLSVKF